MDIAAGPLLTAGLTVVGAIVWFVRLEGRVNLSESRHSDMKAVVEEIRGDVKQLLRQK